MSDPGRTVDPLYRKSATPAQAENITYNPSLEELREFSRDQETTSEFGSPSYVSELRSRSADRTKTPLDDDFDADDHALVEAAFEYAREHEMVCVDRQLGRHAEHTYRCRLILPKEHSRIALAWAKLFEPVDEPGEPDFLTVQIPDWEETAIRVLPDEGVTAVLGSDYLGEAKKSVLRLFMYAVKREGGLGLHAGSKRVTLQDDDGELTRVGQLFLGLSATGKSTLTAHGLWLDDPEGATMLQDDVCALLLDGTVIGSEGNGLYTKTMGLEEAEQPELYAAVTHESAVLENVDVAEDGTVDFHSDRYTSNGRAIILREYLSSADDAIDLDHLDQVFFITRNPIMPPVAKLTPEEAAAAFMLGESIQTSAGDPDAAGESIRVVGTNPFIVGSEGEEGNRFRDLIANLGVECFVLNTGYLGARARDIGVEDTVSILQGIARGTVTWRDDRVSGLTVPDSVPGMDIEEFDPAVHVDDYENKLMDLQTERRAYLEAFEDLDDEIRNAVY